MTKKEILASEGKILYCTEYRDIKDRKIQIVNISRLAQEMTIIVFINEDCSEYISKDISLESMKDISELNFYEINSDKN